MEIEKLATWHNWTYLKTECKEIEENNRMGKTRDLFKKIRDTKGTFHAKIGSIKDRPFTITQKFKRGCISIRTK